MRKLSVLLPIARKRLITAENPVPVHDRNDPDCSQGFTCDAALFCKSQGEMTLDEYLALAKAIEAEIVQQGARQGVYLRSTPLLYELLDKLHVFTSERTSKYTQQLDPAYFPHRDAWLDAFQAKLDSQ